MTTLRAPAPRDSQGNEAAEIAEIIMPPHLSISRVPVGLEPKRMNDASGVPDRDSLLARLRDRASRLRADYIAKLLKLDE